MQQFQSKMWSGAGALAAVCAAMAPTGAAKAADPQPATEESVFPGDFDRALTLMMLGEGGEGGIGMFRMWPTAAVPALNTAQIAKAVSGNSLVVPHHYTMQFNTDGTVGGYDLKYEQRPLAQCPRTDVIGDTYLLSSIDGKCWNRAELKYTGTWRADANRLCLDIIWDGGTRKDCYHMVFMLDSVGLFQPDGRLYAKGHKLKRGAARHE